MFLALVEEKEVQKGVYLVIPCMPKKPPYDYVILLQINHVYGYSLKNYSQYLSVKLPKSFELQYSFRGILEKHIIEKYEQNLHITSF